MPAQPHEFNLRHLLAAAAIARTGSMSAAAAEVNLTQPALTQGIAKLERQLGAALFVRHAGGMDATDEGALLADRIDRAVGQLATAVSSPARLERSITAVQMRAFIALADAGSLVEAAERSGMSQDSIQRAGRELEQGLSLKLAERRGPGITLTEAGRRLARGMRLATVEIAAAIGEITGYAAEPAAIIIGAMPLCRARLLPRALNRLTRRLPELRLIVVEGSWRELVEPLRDGAVDLLVGALRLSPAPPDLRQTPLFKDRLIVLARPGHRLAGNQRPSLRQLAAESWIVGPSLSPLRAQWERLFARVTRPRAPIECGSVMTIREMLRDSDFLTLLSPDQVAVEVACGLLTQIGPPLRQGVRTIGITTRSLWRPTRMQQALLDTLAEVAREGAATPSL